MSKLEKLDLMGVSSLAAVTAALLVAWMVTTHEATVRHTRQAAQQDAVTLTDDGRMKVTVTAGRSQDDAPPPSTTRTASARASGGPSLEVALPIAFRP